MKTQEPYYAVIFTSQRLKESPPGYEDMSQKMMETVKDAAGFLGVESVHNDSGLGITISYWESLDAVKKWREHAEHVVARKLGKEKWYQSFKVRICQVAREYSFQL